MDDVELLRQYAETQSETAFAELVQRYLNLVYSAALRQVEGDSHRAQDVVQVVFSDLARKAPSLRRHPSLAGWLYTSTHYAAAKMMRAERRRSLREQEATIMHEFPSASAAPIDWDHIRPVLDQAVHELEEDERDAVVLRFFDQRRMTEVGDRLGLTESAARKRTERALENLRLSLARRGITSSTAVLAVALENNSLLAAPAGMAASVASSALSGLAGSGILTTASLMSMTKLQTGILGVLAASGLGLLGLSFISPTEKLAGVPPGAAADAPASGSSAGAAAAASASTANAGYSPDLGVFLANLRASGRSDKLIRTIMAAAIDEQFRAREEQLQPPREPEQWWRYETPRISLQVGMALLDLKREKARVRQQLLGPDPDAVDAAETDNPIALEKRETARMIDEDYNVMIGSIRGLSGSLMLPSERAQVELLKQARTKDYTFLTPEENDAWRMRTSRYTKALRPGLMFFEPTDAEWKMLYAHDRGLNDPEWVGPRPTAEQVEAEERAAMGDARYTEYERSRHRNFQLLQELVLRSGLSPDVTRSVYKLQKTIGPASEGIAADPTLSAAGKTEALRQLGQKARAEIQQALGPEISAAYLRVGGNAWLEALEKGSVVTITRDGWNSRPAAVPRLTPPPPRPQP